ncbi:hypothetical protein TSOC_008412 [Tetrabaena socialis]|uniref:Uncharacterized protein n=1 Tax=Tetrabaena socialis TaxID=47790 RepID=A0A2J7ZYJ7_9CHLO|nr:hypothetical protein TSOC_008412 [Tetrabaena socialis]|eukprot:PNH05343.1 hypothetical protein TSOC_008412 [Tetrabaena socialis]
MPYESTMFWKAAVNLLVGSNALQQRLAVPLAGINGGLQLPDAGGDLAVHLALARGVVHVAARRAEQQALKAVDFVRGEGSQLDEFVVRAVQTLRVVVHAEELFLKPLQLALQVVKLIRAALDLWQRQRAAPAEPAAATSTTSNGGASPEHYDVAIVGGGPAGLLAAKALMAALPAAKVKVEVLGVAGRCWGVFEAAAGYRPQGAGVLIEVNGMRARGILISGSIFYDEAGNASRPSPPTPHEANTQAHGHTAVMVHWGDIREALFEALPEGTGSFSTRVVDITPGQPGGEPAKLQLQEAGDAGASTRTVTAGLVIAADGYYSRTKRVQQQQRQQRQQQQQQEQQQTAKTPNAASP